ncbi:MAG: 2-amino-4-hydroxy-6-hydroxymethyldihydropteridine pyrophosphokinae [Acidobacteriaceae bacterium]|nr:2-amino-4-hydroxy-6-hydroxymethyldihydropteridine pyrophosphokinae [Acidobacteriaceae bacterium]
MKTTYLSLGSNVGDREGNLRAAIEQLSRVGRVLAVSSFYETEPVELKDQAWFLNCVVELETEMSAAELLDALLSIERAMGRERIQAKGPRNIDIDILLCGDAVIDEKGLKVPHPAMHRRRFVLAPLAEIAPDAIHPVFKRSARELLEGLPEGDVVRKS